MSGTIKTNGSTAPIKIKSNTHVHVQGTFQSGTLVLEYKDDDVTFRPIVGASYTTDADSFMELPYGIDVRLTLAGATDETIATQDETDFDGAGNNGTFVAGDGVGGTAYVALDTITLSEGSVITVDAVDGDGDVTQFTVTSKSTSDVGGPGSVLTQTSTSGSGVSFQLTVGVANTVSPNIFYEIH